MINLNTQLPIKDVDHSLDLNIQETESFGFIITDICPGGALTYIIIVWATSLASHQALLSHKH